MSYIKTNACIGFLVLIMPFLGFPGTWKNTIYFILGLLLIISAIFRYERSRMRKKHLEQAHQKTFEESEINA